jgi:hypothetical protein
MSDPGDPPSRDGTEPAAGPLARLFATQLLAVLAITVVLTGIFAVVKRGDSGAGISTSASTSSSSSTPTSPSPSTPASRSASPATTPPSPSTASAAPTSGPPRNRPEVVVFNQSAPGGTGQEVAALLRDKGWTVFKVDNFRGNVSRTTVYYPPGLKGAARRAAEDLPGPVRVRPTFSNLSTTRLTVILTDDFRGSSGAR